MSTPVYKLLAQSRKLLVKKLCRIVCAVFLQLTQGHKTLGGLVSKHKLEHLGFNLSHSKLAAPGRLVWRSSAFMGGLADRSANRPVL